MTTQLEMTMPANKEEQSRAFAYLVLLLQGFYYQGMPLEDLAHRLRINATEFTYVLTKFKAVQGSRHDA